MIWNYTVSTGGHTCRCFAFTKLGAFKKFLKKFDNPNLGLITSIQPRGKEELFTLSTRLLLDCGMLIEKEEVWTISR